MTKNSKKKLPNKKIIRTAKFEANEQFTQSALNNLTEENDRLIQSLKKTGDFDDLG